VINYRVLGAGRRRRKKKGISRSLIQFEGWFGIIFRPKCVDRNKIFIFTPASTLQLQPSSSHSHTARDSSGVRAELSRWTHGNSSHEERVVGPATRRPEKGRSAVQVQCTMHMGWRGSLGAVTHSWALANEPALFYSVLLSRPLSLFFWSLGGDIHICALQFCKYFGSCTPALCWQCGAKSIRRPGLRRSCIVCGSCDQHHMGTNWYFLNIMNEWPSIRILIHLSKCNCHFLPLCFVELIWGPTFSWVSINFFIINRRILQWGFIKIKKRGIDVMDHRNMIDPKNIKLISIIKHRVVHWMHMVAARKDNYDECALINSSLHEITIR
jgi:hypothetical protein